MGVGLEALPDDYRRNVIVWVCAIVACAGFLAVLGKRFDWQRLDPVRTCRHCLLVHVIAGMAATVADGITLSGLFVLGLEPFLAAVRAEAYPPLNLGIVATIVVAGLAALVGIGFVARWPSGTRSGVSRGDATANLIAGTRIAAVLIGGWMFVSGFGRASIASRLMSALGARLGSRLYFAIGGAAIRDTVIVLLAGCVISALIRWLAPLVAGSKPLVLMAQTKAVAA